MYTESFELLPCSERSRDKKKKQFVLQYNLAALLALIPVFPILSSVWFPRFLMQIHQGIKSTKRHFRLNVSPFQLLGSSGAILRIEAFPSSLSASRMWEGKMFHSWKIRRFHSGHETMITQGGGWRRETNSGEKKSYHTRRLQFAVALLPRLVTNYTISAKKCAKESLPN